MRMSPHQLALGFDKQQAIVTQDVRVRLDPRGRHFLDRQAREGFSRARRGREGMTWPGCYLPLAF